MTKSLLGLLPGAGGAILMAQMAPIIEGADKMKEWPVTVLLAVLVMSALSLLYFVLRKVFDERGKLSMAIQSQAVATTKAAAAMNELNARLNQRPCLIRDEGGRMRAER